MFVLPNAACSHKRRFFSPHCSNYVTNSAAARLHCTSHTVLCTAYVKTLNVSVLLHKDIYSIFLQLLRTNIYSFLMTTQQHFLVTCSYILGYSLSCHQGDTVSGIGQLLIKHSKLLYDIGHKFSNMPVHTLHISTQDNSKTLIKYILQNTFNLYHIICESCLSESSMLPLNAFLYMRIMEALIGTNSWAVKQNTLSPSKNQIRVEVLGRVVRQRVCLLLEQPEFQCNYQYIVLSLPTKIVVINT